MKNYFTTGKTSVNLLELSLIDLIWVKHKKIFNYDKVKDSRFNVERLFSSFFFYPGCAVNPVTGKKQLVLMSEQQEIALGAESDPQIIAQLGFMIIKLCRILLIPMGRKWSKYLTGPI